MMNLIGIGIVILISIIYIIGCSYIIRHTTMNEWFIIIGYCAIVIIFAFGYWVIPFNSETIAVEIAQNNMHDKYILLDEEKGKLRFTKVSNNKNESITINVDGNVKIITPYETDKKKATLTYTQRYTLSQVKLDIKEVILEIPNK